MICVLFQDTMQVRLILLSEFGTSQHVLPHLLTSLCQCLYKYSKTLRTNPSNELSTNPVKFCNMFYIIQACGKCLVASKSKKLEQTFRDNLRGILDDSLLHLTNMFPLYAHAIWRVCRLL